MKSERLNTPPPQIEDLGEGTYYYNFNVVESITEEGDTKYNYDQVRCTLPVDALAIQTAVDIEGYEHTVNLD